ncbi:MAG: hypothetical protein IKV80_07100 [Bacteroidales bacterium]|nr:hypothetical protein [Bacteroidales bacterium]
MQITIYSGFSKEVNSTKQPTGGTAVSCTLKENTSLVNPVFILNAANFSTNYVSWNGRYYFVDDIVSIRNGAVEVHCKIDVLATYKTAIGTSSQYVTRSASRYDPSIVDNKYPTLTKTNIIKTELNTIHSQITSGGCYVIGILGGGIGALDGVKYFIMSPSDFAGLMDFMTDDVASGILDAPVTEISKALQKELINPYQYIVSCMYFPFTISSAQVSQNIKFGWWEYNASFDYIDPSDVNGTTAHFADTFTISMHPQAGETGGTTSYLLASPYTRLLLHCYAFGDVPLDPLMFKNVNGDYKGKIDIYVDYYSGVALLEVSNDNGAVVSRNWAQFGVPVQISQVTQSLLNGAVGAVSTAGAVLQGNFIGVLSGVGDAVQGMLPQVEKSGAYGSRAQFMVKPSLTIIHTYITSPDRTHNGAPLMDRVTINNLSGYIQVENPDVDIAGTLSEKNEIIGYMQGGFYYE